INMLKNENIICVSTMNWDFLWTRKQRFMNMLSKEGNKVLYVEPPFYTKEKSLKSKMGDFAREARKGFFSRLTKVNDNLYVLYPSILIPAGKHPFILALNQFILRGKIKNAQRKLNMKNSILWIYDPFRYGLAGTLSEKMSIYDCVDEHSEYPGVNKKLTLKVERELISRVDLFIVTAKGLYESKKSLNKNIHVISNGVDYALFSKAQDDTTKIPEDITNLPKPVIGFTGGISDWIDLDLIYYIAKENPAWSIVMVGPVDKRAEKKVEEFKDMPNVYFLGRKKLEELPNYMKGFDVCLNPFRVNALTAMVSPLKVFEYLASGRPIVSTDMPEVRPFAEVVKIAHGKEEFLACIKKVLSGEPEDAKSKCLEIAKEYSWEKLLDNFVGYIEETLRNNGKKTI
ncbi:MAG: glycosyltransferase, partial [Candidatus Omnitrophota bacterium]